MVGFVICFYFDKIGCVVCEEFKEFCLFDCFIYDFVGFFINVVYLENLFGDVDFYGYIVYCGFFGCWEMCVFFIWVY